jgi:hypothetical protein
MRRPEPLPDDQILQLARATEVLAVELYADLERKGRDRFPLVTAAWVRARLEILRRIAEGEPLPG